MRSFAPNSREAERAGRPGVSEFAAPTEAAESTVAKLLHKQCRRVQAVNDIDGPTFAFMSAVLPFLELSLKLGGNSGNHPLAVNACTHGRGQVPAQV